jgi:succinate-semialdehyde dehydrogenase/glutarate-semialdehyde dehydrogenase
MILLVEEFTARLNSAISEFRYGDPLEQGVTHGPMSSEDAMKRAITQVDKAVEHGATLVTGGKQLDREGFFMGAGSSRMSRRTTRFSMKRSSDLSR